MNGETTKADRLQALLDKVLVNAAALRDMRKAGATPPAVAPAPVSAKPALNAPRGGTLEPVPFVPERNLGGIAEFSTPAARPETEPVLLVKRVQPAPEPVAQEAAPVARAPVSVVGEEFDPNTTAELPILEPEIEAEPPLVLEPEISPVEPEPHYAGPSGEPAPPIMAEAEPSSSDRRAALNLEVPRAPAVPFLEPARAGDSLEAPPLPPVEMEVVDLEASGEELTTIPPSAPSAASSPHEPPPLELEADFSAPAVVQPPEADFSLSAPPQLEDIEAPPISTEQERDESEGLGVSLGFSPQAAAPNVVEEEEDDDRHGAPRTPPPESGPQVSLAPKEPEGLDVQTPSQPDFRGERGEGPTMEQVGSTISFSAEERVSRELELEESAIAAAKSAADDFEAELPKVGFAGAYDASLAPPATARQELEAHDREERERAERRSFVPGSGPVVAETAIPGALQGYPLETVSRSPVNVSSPAAIYDSTRGNLQPGSFLDRLEASLSLAGPSE